MFFKSRAQKLVEALDAACEGPAVTPEDFRKYKEIDEKIREWGARHPEEFIPFLNDERANSIGEWIRGSAEKGVGLLRKLICDPGSSQRRAALRALWEFEEEAASEISLLAELLSDSDPRIRQSAAHCLGRIGPVAVGAGAHLAELAQYGDDAQKVSAFFALERTGYAPAITVQICYDAVQAGPENVREAALSTLRSIGADPNPVVDVILRLFSESDGISFGSSAIELIERCDLTDEALRSRAVRALESFIMKDPPNRTNSLCALWNIDPGNAVVFARVEMDLRSDGSEMESACDVICQMKADAARFIPLIVQKLEKHWEYWDFCWAAVDALGAMGPAASNATSTLEKLRSHPSGLVQERVQEALEKIAG